MKELFFDSKDIKKVRTVNVYLFQFIIFLSFSSNNLIFHPKTAMCFTKRSRGNVE
jgi:hypothetical protein